MRSFNSWDPTVSRGFESRTLFFECRSKGIGSPTRRLTYEINGEEVGSGKKAAKCTRLVNIRAIILGPPVLRFKNVVALQVREAARRVRQQPECR
jgi:hypothetical protein